MPEEYNISQLTRFGYSYEHIGSLLNIFSQLTTCKIMFLLRDTKELEVSEIRKELGNIQSFIVSKSLTSLRNNNIIDKVERTYTLKNDIFFQKLYDATANILESMDKPHEITEYDLKEVAKLFSDLFFDPVSNVLIHILITKPRKFNEISNMYRDAHGYVATSTLRYHLSTRKVDLEGHRLKIFDVRERNYILSEEGRKIHNIFDNFIDEYEKAIEKWIEDMWKLPVKDLTGESTPIIDLRDSAHKILRLLYNSDFIIAFSTEPEGIITTKNVMNRMGEKLNQVGFLANTTVEDIMTPITKDQVISGEISLLQLFKENKGFEHNHYIVDRGKGMYSVLSIYNVLKRFGDV